MMTQKKSRRRPRMAAAHALQSQYQHQSNSDEVVLQGYGCPTAYCIRFLGQVKAVFPVIIGFRLRPTQTCY